MLRILLSQAFERASAAFCALIISASLMGRGGRAAPALPGGLVWPVVVIRRPPTEVPPCGAGDGAAPGAGLWARAGVPPSRRLSITT